MGKLFGTDGIRGVVNEGLDGALAYQVGLATAHVLKKEHKEGRPLVVIGKDTRISSDLLEGALTAGLCSMGVDVLSLGVIPTPGVAWLAIAHKADAGIVISASHNPFEHNGIKIFNGQGFKLSDELEAEIEEFILGGTVPTLPVGGEVGHVLPSDGYRVEHYLAHLASTVGHDFKNLRILVDCANGAASATAKNLFDRFARLHVDIINADPDGVNINSNCGSTHLGTLKAMVKAGNYDLGLAFDGDADRCLAVDELGEEIDGDQMMAICGLARKKEGKLAGNTIVATVMSNLGFHGFTKSQGIDVICANVGDRNVLEEMQKGGYTVGGEQSGHLIFLDHATTGDGQLAALQFMQVLCDSGLKASELIAPCCRFPQVLLNVPVKGNKEKDAIMAWDTLWDAVKQEEEALAGEGRILVRPSGTEALVRVMVEARTQEGAQAVAQRLVDLLVSYT